MSESKKQKQYKPLVPGGLASDVFDPANEVRILSVGTSEWKARQEEKEKWLRDNPPPPAPPCGYHVTTTKDGVTVWEQRYATPEQIAAKRAEYGETQPVIKHKFIAVVDSKRRQWAVRQNNLTHFFSSSDNVAIFCRKLSRGEPGQVEFYTAPKTPLDEWQGDDLGDYITTESW